MPRRHPSYSDMGVAIETKKGDSLVSRCVRHDGAPIAGVGEAMFLHPTDFS